MNARTPRAAPDPRWTRRWLPARVAALVQVVLLAATVTFCIVVLAMAAADPGRDSSGLVSVLMSVALFLLVAPTVLAAIALVLVLLRRSGGLVLMILYALMATLTAVLITIALSAGTGTLGDLVTAIAFPVVWGVLALAAGVVALLTLRIVRREPDPDRPAQSGPRAWRPRPH